MSDNGKAVSALTWSTLAFTACFAAWMLNGVLVTFLVDHGAFPFDKVQVGWLLGIPVLTGSLLRLPVGVMTDRYGGRPVFTGVLLAGAAGLLLLSYATSFAGFVVGSLGFGLAGTSFAVGVGYTSVWFSKERQGTALGIFGAGNAGSAVTSIFAPMLLAWLTSGGRDLERWRLLPRLYAVALLAMAVFFFAFTKPRRAQGVQGRTIAQQLAVLSSLRVWRFGLYYFLVFGCFVALAQWLIPYYVSVFGMSLAKAGLLAAIFSFPSGVVRALGGWLSDRYGARATMYGVLGVCVVGCLALSIPPLELSTPGQGVLAGKRGTVTAVSATEIVVDGLKYPLKAKAGAAHEPPRSFMPRTSVEQTPAVAVGDKVVRKQLLARGVTRVSFAPNIWMFTAIVFLVGIALGVGKAAVYKHIPEYFPGQVGVVGGIVGVIGGLGGFLGPILFGYFLEASGLWVTCWLFLFALSAVCLTWMHVVVVGLERQKSRALERLADEATYLPRAAAAPAPSSFPRPSQVS